VSLRSGANVTLYTFNEQVEKVGLRTEDKKEERKKEKKRECPILGTQSPQAASRPEIRPVTFNLYNIPQS
jgi:hypothetical protein